MLSTSLDACRYDPESEIANIVSGVLDSLSAGILIYTGLVELLAHDFIFNREMAVEASNAKVAFAVYVLFPFPDGFERKQN